MMMNDLSGFPESSVCMYVCMVQGLERGPKCH